VLVVSLVSKGTVEQIAPTIDTYGFIIHANKSDNNIYYTFKKKIYTKRIFSGLTIVYY
jgi:hypothetical protein